MGIGRLTSRAAVLAAIRLYDELGQAEFLSRFGFGEARAYLLVHDGRSYDSKAVAGVAYGLQFPAEGTLSSAEFSGGIGPAGAATVLRNLNFEVHGSGSRASTARSEARPPSLPSRALDPATGSRADVLLLGCVKQKRTAPAPACDLYTSDLFRKRRTYAEQAGLPWFILSALHGLVDTGRVIEPYDMALKDQSTAYRRDWGERAGADLLRVTGIGAGSIVEVHAGSAYVDAIAPPLTAAGIDVLWPLRGLTFGQQLAWYATPSAQPPVAGGPSRGDVVREAVRLLSDHATAREPLGFPWGRSDLDVAGLYSWWVDGSGAAALSRGLGVAVADGLVYAGQAGATSPGRADAASTLRSRIGGNHLRGGIHGSTWRKSLAAVLRDGLALDFEGSDLDSESQASLNRMDAPAPAGCSGTARRSSARGRRRGCRARGAGSATQPDGHARDAGARLAQASTSGTAAPDECLSSRGGREQGQLAARNARISPRAPPGRAVRPRRRSRCWPSCPIFSEHGGGVTLWPR